MANEPTRDSVAPPIPKAPGGLEGKETQSKRHRGNRFRQATRPPGLAAGQCNAQQARPTPHLTQSQQGFVHDS